MQLTKAMLGQSANHVYDALVVGGGAAGIYLQRYLLSTLIVDKGKARSFWMQELHNYLGLPADTPGREVLKQGKAHYLDLEGDYLNAYVEEVVDEGDGTIIELDTGLVSMGSKYHADYLNGIELEYKGGNLVTDAMNRTSHPRIFAVGDLKVGMNQVTIAAADGAQAATQIWRDIRRAEGTRRPAAIAA